MAILDEAAEILGEESKATPKAGKASNKFADVRDTLAKRLKRGEEFFTIRNGSSKLFHIDWSLGLLPPDLRSQTDKYFEEKYVQYAGEKFIPNVSFLVIRTQDRRTVNLLDNFVVEKRVPVMMPLPVGKDIVVKSQFVIDVDETVLVNADQREALQNFIKYKREWTDDNGNKRSSSWLGFLISKPVTLDNIKMVDFDRPVLTEEDLRLVTDIEAPEVQTNTEQRFGDIVYADE